MKLFLKIFILLFITNCSLKYQYYPDNSSKYWAKISDKNKFCVIGSNQSPIDIKLPFINNELSFNYSLGKENNVQKIIHDHVLRSVFFDKSYINRIKKKYYLRYFEFHHPSEHHVNSNPAVLEMQIAHKSEDEQWLILSLFLELGKHNKNFNEIINFIENKKIKEANINLDKIIKTNDQVFFYEGSFTTPPCSEGVKWYIFKTPIYLSKEQLNSIIKNAIFVNTNARELQKFNPEGF